MVRETAGERPPGTSAWWRRSLPHRPGGGGRHGGGHPGRAAPGGRPGGRRPGRLRAHPPLLGGAARAPGHGGGAATPRGRSRGHGRLGADAPAVGPGRAAPDRPPPPARYRSRVRGSECAPLNVAILPGAMTSLVYVGTYTGPERAQGISVFRLDPESGPSTPQTVTGLNSPTFLALHPQFPARPFLYAVERQAEEPGLESGAVSSFAVDPRQGTLTLLNRQPSGGLSLLRQRPPSGEWSSPRTTPAGTWPPSRCCRTEPWAPERGAAPGQRPRGARQEGPHAHSIGPSPDGRFVLACDLGIDRVMVYRLVQTASRSGLAGERSPRRGGQSRLRPPALRLPSPAAVRLRGQRAGLPRSPSTPTTSDGAWTTCRPSCPRISAGRATLPRSSRTPRGAVYASNRGHDSIAVFAVDGASGRLTPTGHTSTGGASRATSTSTPRGACSWRGTRTAGRWCRSASTLRAGPSPPPDG